MAYLSLCACPTFKKLCYQQKNMKKLKNAELIE